MSRRAQSRFQKEIGQDVVSEEAELNAVIVNSARKAIIQKNWRHNNNVPFLNNRNRTNTLHEQESESDQRVYLLLRNLDFIYICGAFTNYYEQ